MKQQFASIHNTGVWTSLSTDEQNRIIALLNKELQQDFEHLFTRNYAGNPSLNIPTYRHIASGIEMNLIIGGRYTMGLIEEEEQQAYQIATDLPFGVHTMRPTREVIVKPFLMSRFPVLEPFAAEYIELDKELFRPEFADFGEKVPVYLTRDEINSLKVKFNLSIPSESQWEYAVRGDTTSLFYFGTTIPDDHTLDSQILLYNFEDEDANLAAANAFGLVGLNVGEWCEDSYRENYRSHVPLSNESIKGSAPFVVRAGAAAVWPWQDGSEWSLCMSAMRQSSEVLEDGTCGVRFVKDLEVAN